MTRHIATALMLMAAAWPCLLHAAPSARARDGRGKAIELIAEGQAHEKQGDMAAATDCYYRSSQMAPSPAAFYNLGRVSRSGGNRDEARRYLDQALQLNPSYELARMEMLQLEKGSGGKSTSVRTVSSETAASAGTGAIDSPMNVESLRRENLTLQSLRKPLELAADTSVIAPDAKPGGGPPQPTSPRFTAPAPGFARRSAEPQQPGYIENVSDIKVVDSRAGDPPLGRASIDSGEPGETRGQSINAEPALRPVPLAEEPAATEEVVVERSTKPAVRRPADTMPPKPTADEINEAAFGEESKNQPESTGFQQTKKVALGTFAFHRDKGDQYSQAGRYADAAVEYESALKLSPGDAETRAALAEMMSRTGKTAAAGKQFKKAEAIDPDEPGVHYKQGNAYFDEGKYDLAIGSFQKAINLDPDHKFAQNNLGVVYMEKKEYARAVAKFKRVLEIDPNYNMAVLNLGIIYDEHLVDKDEARKYYEKYIELKGPRSGQVKEWLEKLKNP